MERLTIKAPSGLIHLKDNAEMTVNTAIKKLAEYEDLEEQGKLLKLPCAVGDTVYYIAPKRRNYEELKVIFFNAFSENEIYMRCDSVKSPHISYGEIDVDEIGKTVFLTREEAESALKELEEKHAESSEQ